MGGESVSFVQTAMTKMQVGTGTTQQLHQQLQALLQQESESE